MAGGLPPVPEVFGTLAIDVVYPAEGASLADVDSTFIFGTVGRGDASLTINGIPVDVAPNGAWLAYLPVPPDGTYQLSASAGGQTVSATRTVRLPEPPLPSSAELHIIPNSVSPSGAVAGVRGETLQVRFRGTAGAEATLILPDGTTIPMTERQAIDRASGFMLERVQVEPGISEYVGTMILERTIASPDPSIPAPPLVSEADYVRAVAEQGGAGIVVELRRGNEVVGEILPVAIGVLEVGSARYAVGATLRADSTVIGRRGTGADQAWDFFWPNGTVLPLDGARDGYYRVRLAPDITAWVLEDDVQLLPEGWVRPDAFVGPSIQLTPRTDATELNFALSERVPYRVVPHEQELVVEFYGATGRPAYVGYGQQDDFVRLVSWDQPSDQVFRFRVQLSRPLWGYRARWSGTRLILDVRKPPVVDPSRPLQGIRVAVDAGHRNGEGDTGAIGPTRLQEADATLAIVQRLIPKLRERGAEIVPIRTDETFLPLIERPLRAEAGDAHVFISIHFNAFPDGVDPFANHGTTSFYHWPHSLPLARHLQRELLAALGLPDRGVRFQNLGIPRTTWMPSVLTETLFMMLPEQEAALRDAEVQERIADAHRRAIEAFVLERAVVSEAGP